MHMVFVSGCQKKDSEEKFSGRTGMIELGIHKELSKSYREGTPPKLESMALPYETKVWKKVDRILC